MEVEVRQVWEQYSLDVQGESRLKTDREGRVAFPKREVRTSIIGLLCGAFNEFRQVGIHASFTSSESVLMKANNQIVSFYDGKGLETSMVTLDFAAE